MCLSTQHQPYNPVLKKAYWLRYLIVLLSIFFSSFNLLATSLPVQLANVYDENLDVQDFLISEKFDGIRAIWKNGSLQTRQGNPIHAPKWFTSTLPDIWLDGELWSNRQDFEFVTSTVRKLVPIDSEWRQIKYMVFDAPNYSDTFQTRALFYTQTLDDLNLEHVKPVEQKRLDSNAALSEWLRQLVEEGAEGLILHKTNALFKEGRSDNLLKLKPYMDSEAIVLEHLPGKGKYKGLLGAIRVRWYADNSEPVEFKIGSGFSDVERENPPAIGSEITFKYHGLTKKRVPRFASYLRLREDG